MKEQKLHVITFQKIVGNAYIWLLDTHKTIWNGLVKLEQIMQKNTISVHLNLAWNVVTNSLNFK